MAVSKKQLEELGELELLGTKRMDHPLNVLFLIERLDKQATGPSICRVLNCKRTTFSRRKRALRDLYGIKMTFHSEPFIDGKGYYTIDDWGVIAREAFMRFMNQKIEAAVGDRLEHA